MRQFERSWSVVTAVLAILVFVALPASAATPPFFGPPNMHANTEPGTVDVGGAAQQAYARPVDGWPNTFYLQSPWSACQGEYAFRVTGYVTGAVSGKYDRFQDGIGRIFTIDQLDADGNYIGGTLDVPWSSSGGTLTLVKSVAGQATYDQVHLVGTKSVGGGSQPVNVYLSLAEQGGYIGVANLASLGVIGTCGQANANSQIMLPLGTGDNGQPTIVPDINGDGVADPEFLQGPPLSGSAAPPIPTLTEWGFIAMTLILLIVGLRFFRNNASPLSA